MPLAVHTASLAYTGADRFDVSPSTTQAGARCFAPPAEEISSREAYVESMRAVWRRDRGAFQALLGRASLTLVCGCDDDARCHRRVLAEILVKLGATYAGERARALPPEAPPSWTSPADWKRRPWLVVDCETTGLSSAKDRIIELALCRVERGAVVETTSWLVHPELPELPDAITAITGLTIADLDGKPRFAEVAHEVESRLAGAEIIVAYNAAFDRGFVAEELRRSGRELPARARGAWLDPWVYVKEYDRYERGKKLTDAARRRGIVVAGAHRAAADAEMAARLLMALLSRLPDDHAELIAQQQAWHDAQEADFQAWRARQPQPGLQLQIA